MYCVAAGATLLAHLWLFDERFRESGRSSHLPPGLHFSRSERTDAIVALVPALRHPHYKGRRGWLRGTPAYLGLHRLNFRSFVRRRRWYSPGTRSHLCVNVVYPRRCFRAQGLVGSRPATQSRLRLA